MIKFDPKKAQRLMRVQSSRYSVGENDAVLKVRPKRIYLSKPALDALGCEPGNFIELLFQDGYLFIKKAPDIDELVLHSDRGYFSLVKDKHGWSSAGTDAVAKLIPDHQGTFCYHLEPVPDTQMIGCELIKQPQGRKE